MISNYDDWKKIRHLRHLGIKERVALMKFILTARNYKWLIDIKNED